MQRNEINSASRETTMQKTPTLRPCVLHNTYLGGFICAVLYDGKVYVSSHKERTKYYDEIPLETVGDIFLYDLPSGMLVSDCVDFMQLEMDAKWGYCDLRTNEIVIGPQWNFHAGYYFDKPHMENSGVLIFYQDDYGHPISPEELFDHWNHRVSVKEPCGEYYYEHYLIERNGKCGAIRVPYIRTPGEVLDDHHYVTYDSCEVVEFIIPLEWNGIQYYDGKTYYWCDSIGKNSIERRCHETDMWYEDGIDIGSYEFWIGYKAVTRNEKKSTASENSTVNSDYEYAVISIDGEIIIDGLSFYPERYWDESAYFLIGKNGKYGLVGPIINGNSRDIGVVVEPTMEKSEAEAIMGFSLN
jgi:hypothetical protein